MIFIAAISLVLNLAAWAIAFLFPRHESAAILHYTSSVGIDFVGEGRHIIVLPAAGALILILNLIVGRLAESADRRVSWMLWITIPIIQGMLIMSLIFLIKLNH
jgi:hypothetical protein